MAYAPSRSDLDRYIRPWLDAVLGRPEGGNTARRRGLVSARCEALAWCNANGGDDAYRSPGTSRWQGRGLDGEGQRRTVRQPPVSSRIHVRRTDGVLFTPE